MTQDQGREELHQQRLSEAQQALATFAVQHSRLGNLRGITFASAVVCSLFSLKVPGWTLPTVSLVSFMIFLYLLRQHQGVIHREEQAERRVYVRRNALLRVTGGWHELPYDAVASEKQQHPYAFDLDILGKSSLYQKLCCAQTPHGKARLRSWLLTVASKSEIEARQKAVTEMAPRLDERQEFEAQALALAKRRLSDGTKEVIAAAVAQSKEQELPILAWLRGKPTILSSSFLQVVSFLLPLLNISFVTLATLGFLPHWTWLLSLGLSFLLLVKISEPAQSAFTALTLGEAKLGRYGDILVYLENARFTAPWLKARQEKLNSRSGIRPSKIMGQFQTIGAWFEVRQNGLVYPFVNSFLLWDIHCGRALENWREEAKGALESWLEIIGEFEALYSLAGLLGDEPEATLPRIQAEDGERPELLAEDLGHPLLAKSERRTNQLPPLSPGQALLITGSNMSGKSTFLRTIGLNLVLSFCGAPVIARQFQTPRCQLGTSLRIADSLSRGVSHFYAEVEKLADILKLSE
ncbi:MAG: hypothetical protein MK135_17675, partial [Polyangiaceae bacterium]|nr:hypothetical protein [Polyangiaceae bacterium]